MQNYYVCASILIFIMQNNTGTIHILSIIAVSGDKGHTKGKLSRKERGRLRISDGFL